ncbi:uncharacterized protein SCHCODRAFT_02488038 [Schizophyllum commune H4-8]|uniref:Uncharacterized protein n=1 Tax=Schizophyllum commune (strain H4-8 / FGSC 9210) TaxID=578458 RepID=D8PN45_SCHCM|nr:uncharacterized protein SCHCODRAFT_02488038 [Schizophyllum commune H4-8]KAI5898672.1 hypothetical protein SCHCODRAFT_02488038 [Schizophyllum commune H4-8]
MISTPKPLGVSASNIKKRVVAKLATTFKVKPRFSSNQSPDDVADSFEECSFDSRGRISEVVQNVKDTSTLTTAMANIGLQPPTDNVQASEPTTDAVSSTEGGPSTPIPTPATAIGNTASADVIDDAQASSAPVPSTTTIATTTTTTTTTPTTPCIVKPVPVTPVPYSVFQEGCRIAADQLRDRASPRRDTRRYSPLSSRSGKTTTRDRVRAIRGLSDDESDDSAYSVRSPSPKHALGHLLNEQDIAPVSREASPSPAYAAVAAAAAAAVQPEAVDDATHHEAARAELADDEGDESSVKKTKVTTARTTSLDTRKVRQKASAMVRKLDNGSRHAVQKRKKASARRPVKKNIHPPACFLWALYFNRVADGTATEEDRKYVEQQEREQYGAMSDEEEEESEEERCEEEARGVTGERMGEEESDEEESEMEEVMGADDSFVVCFSLSPASFSDDEEMDSSEDEFLGAVPGYVDFGHGDAAYPAFSYLAPGEYAKGGYGPWEAREDTYMDGSDYAYPYTYPHSNGGMDSGDRGDFEEDAAMDDADGEAGYAAAAGGKYAAYQPMLVGRGAMYGGWCGAAIELA